MGPKAAAEVGGRGCAKSPNQESGTKYYFWRSETQRSEHISAFHDLRGYFLHTPTLPLAQGL